MTRKALLALAVLAIWAPLSALALGVGDEAPGFSLKTLTGEEFSYPAGLRGERPLYLMFWATY
ncbi:MAG: hypothetical protein Kow0025_11130 [Thermodesulfovibrionales bacterium]